MKATDLGFTGTRKFLQQALLSIAVAAGMAPRAAHAGAHPLGYQHIAPLPDSRLVPPQTGITIRWGGLLDRATVDRGGLAVDGSSSGAHSGALVLADDGRTLFFRPDRPFAPGEIVSVSLRRGIRAGGGGGLPPLDFRFTVAVAQPPREPRARFVDKIPHALLEMRTGTSVSAPRASRLRPSGPAAASDSVPAGYPTVNLMLADHPDPGVVFLAPFTVGFNARGNLVIVDNRGEPVFYRSWPSTVFDFKRQPNGQLTFFSTSPPRFLAMDSTYTVVDSFEATSGYETDEHDLQLLPNGHALFLALDREFYPMDTVVVGGNPHAIVIGLIVQELDASKNVVFQWRSWDHFRVTDLASCAASLTDSIVDYVHANSIELDADGNLLMSSRHLNEITKIDRQTGDVIWRMGLNARNNQFTFIGDTRSFSNQHDARRQPDGHITLFDNGNCLNPLYSRLVEYEVDETNRTARLLWQYRTPDNTWTPFMGNQQRREGGGITSGWGGAIINPKIIELHGDGSPAYELGLGGPLWWTYRAFRFPWQTTAFVPDRDTLDFGPTAFGGGAPRWLRLTNRLTTPLTISSVSSTNPQFVFDSALPVTLVPGGTDSLAVRFFPTDAGPQSGDLYVRALNDTDLIARVVTLTGIASGPHLSIDDVARSEGNAGATFFMFTVRLDRPAAQTVTFDYGTADSSAVSAAGDYVSTAGTLSIGVGDSTAIADVAVNGDHLHEPDEVFHIMLSNVTNALIGRGTGRGTILDDDPVVLSVRDEVPEQFALHPAWPDPASNGTTVRFDLPRASEVSLEVFDVRGRKVATLASGSRPPGRAWVRWDTRGQPAGLYFIRMRAGAFHATRRLVLRR